MSIIDEQALELLVARAARAAVLEVVAPILERETLELAELVSMKEVGRLLDCTPEHAGRLATEGAFGDVFDVATPGSGRRVRRVTRAAVAAYLDRVREPT